MKKLLAVVMMICAMPAFAEPGPVVAQSLAGSVHNIQVNNATKVMTVTMQSLDDPKAQKQYSIPYSPALSGIAGATGIQRPNNDLVVLRIKKAEGKPLSAEEQKTVATLMEAEKTYAAQPKAVPVATARTVQKDCWKNAPFAYSYAGGGNDATVTLSKAGAGFEAGSYKIVTSPLISGDICNFDFLIARMKKSAGKPITKEEQAMIDELAADTATYQKNQKSLVAVCRVPNSKGQNIVTSFMPGCESLTPEQIKAAPFIEAQPDNMSGIKIADGEPTKYRYAAPVNVRQELLAQNEQLKAKWMNQQ